MQIMVSGRGVFRFVTVGVSHPATDIEPAKVEVPFDFMVGDKILRAGVYQVEESGTPGLLRFRCQAGGHDQILVQTINGSETEAIPAKVLFLVQQNTYYLGQALMAAM
jgi:hypothetical protein